MYFIILNTNDEQFTLTTTKIVAFDLLARTLQQVIRNIYQACTVSL